MSQLKVPGLYPHQEADAALPQAFHLCRWGRRAGKTVYAFNSAVMGRGPLLGDQPQWKGMRHGLDVLWVGRSLDQARAIWTEEVKPRFQAAGGYVNDTLLRATIPGTGMGSLMVCSQDRDSINNARGKGSRIGQVIGDEVAHWQDAESVWLEVLLPLLTDNMGCATFISTTKPGSWFNNKCEAVVAGLSTSEWSHTYYTALDNPVIGRDAFDRMVKEYPPGDPRLDQEVWAKLTAGGAGAAFPEWREEIHTTRGQPFPYDWRFTAGLDWGYASKGCYVLAAHGTNERTRIVDEWAFRETGPRRFGEILGTRFHQLGVTPEYIAYDEAMDHEGPTLMEEITKGLKTVLPNQPVPLVPTPKGPGSRVSSKGILHGLLRFKADADGVVQPWGRPNLTVDRDRCPYIASSFQKLQRDEKKPEDVETKLQDDHGYDAVRYMVMARFPHIGKETTWIPAGEHPGFIPGTFERRDRERSEAVEQRELVRSLEAQGLSRASRYSRPRG